MHCTSRAKRWTVALIVAGTIGGGRLDRTARADDPLAPQHAPRTFQSPFGPDDVRPHIAKLAGPELRGRRGSDARKAADYVAEHLRRAGCRPLFENGEFLQPVPGPVGEDGRAWTAGHNVGAWIPGRDPQLRGEFVLIGAHHDHLGVRDEKIHFGADDNASGVAMLLEVARHVAQSPEKPRRSIAFVAFDLEEHLLWGSRWFVDHPPWPIEQVKLALVADMIGRSLGDLPLPTVFVLGAEHAPRVSAALDRVGTPQGLETARMGIDLIGTRSDYGPFRDRRIPFLFFSTGEHPDYHTPRDVPERIDHAKVARVAGLVEAVVRDVGNAVEPPQWTAAPEPSLEEVRSLRRIAALLLAADEGGTRKLNATQRLVVSHTCQKCEAILERDKLEPGERTWLIRASQLLLLSVF